MVREVVAESLGEIEKVINNPIVSSLLMEHAAIDESWTVRVASTAALLNFTGFDTSELVRAWVQTMPPKEENFDFLVAQRLALLGVKDARIIGALLEEGSRLQVSENNNSLNSLVEILQLLTKVLPWENEEQRVHQFLFKTLEHGNEVVRVAVLQTLSKTKLQEERVIVSLLQALQEGDVGVRMAAVKACAALKIADKRLISALTSLLSVGDKVKENINKSNSVVYTVPSAGTLLNYTDFLANTLLIGQAIYQLASRLQQQQQQQQQ